MESKICTYSEKHVRLQLVRVFIESTSQWIIEMRLNRKMICRWTDEDALLARLYFSHCIARICADRDSSIC